MEVNSSIGRIEEFSGRPSTISLRECKAIFSIVVCELELKYGINYTKAFAFKQLARYVHYKALDVYEQHSPKILDITQIPNPTYATTIATTIATAFQAALQVAIAHHVTVPNNSDLVPISINLFPEQLIAATANNPPTINAPFLLIQWGNSFEFLSWNFRSRVLKKFYNSPSSFNRKIKFKMLYKRLLKLKEDI